MPSSKRVKKVSLTKVSKKAPKETRSAHVDKMRSAVENDSSVFLVRLGARRPRVLQTLHLDTRIIRQMRHSKLRVLCKSQRNASVPESDQCQPGPETRRGRSLEPLRAWQQSLSRESVEKAFYDMGAEIV